VAPSPTVPTAFGIYAVSDGELHELDVLPSIRCPDQLDRAVLVEVIDLPNVPHRRGLN
jgi:hypothetical protein